MTAWRLAPGSTLGAPAAPPVGPVIVRRLLLRFASITAVAGVGFAGLGFALVPAMRGLSDAGSSEEALIDLGPLDQRSYVYAADGSLMTTLQAEIDRQPVPLSEIPQHTVDAVLAVEDAEFYAHDGVNIRSTLRALVRNVDEGSVVQGGSTITQQVVKAEFGDQQTIGRKAREAVLARRLEDLMTKDEILERYLNTVYLGNGAYGVQAGAETYFDMGVADLDIGQSAFLAGMIANPSEYDPIRHPEESRQRWDVALQRLVEVDRLTPDERTFIAAGALPKAINQFNPETLDYFTEEVKQQLFNDPRLGATREERQNRVFRGGLRIFTTLDPRASCSPPTRATTCCRRWRPRAPRRDWCRSGLTPPRARPATPRERWSRSSRAPARYGRWWAAPGSPARSTT